MVCAIPRVLPRHAFDTAGGWKRDFKRRLLGLVGYAINAYEEMFARRQRRNNKVGTRQL